jgi:hypothetical protein
MPIIKQNIEGIRMSLNEPPASKENEMTELKSKLNDFIDRYSITKFEGEDIVELIEEGEEIDWIVDQLKGNSPAINIDEIKALLTDIRTLAGPEKAPEYAETEPEDNEAAEESAVESGLSELDLSPLDLTRLAGMMPPGVKLPPGFGVKQLKDLMSSPQGKIMSDFLLFCREKGFDVSEGMLDDPKTQDLQNEWKSTPREALDGKTPAEMMEENPALMPGKVETYRRKEQRIGRNDPCPCGSGKKYKKCCGRI